MEFNRNLIDAKIQIDAVQDQLGVDEPVVRVQYHFPIGFTCHNLRFRIHVPKSSGASKEEMKKPVVHNRNQSSIRTVLTLYTVGFYDVKIIALYLGEAGKYRLDRELTIAINNSDIFAAAGVEPSAHIPAHRPLFCLGQHAHIRQPFREPPADLWGSVV